MSHPMTPPAGSSRPANAMDDGGDWRTCPRCEGCGTVDGPGGDERCYNCGGRGEILEDYPDGDEE